MGACLRADWQGLLLGDLNCVQSIAKRISRMYDMRVAEARRKADLENIKDVVELYIRLNFPELWDSMEAARRAQPDDEVKLDELEADTMDEMIQKMRAVAGML